MKRLSTLQFCAIEYFLILANNVGLTTLVLFHNARVDCLFSCVLGFVLGFIPLFLYLKIMNSSPELNIFEKIDLRFKRFGWLVSLILVIGVLFFSITNYNNLIDFISSQYLSKTPQLFIAFSFFPAIVYILNKGTAVIGRTVFILLLISCVLVFLTFMGLIWQVRIDNVLPIFENGVISPIVCSLIYVAFNVSPLFLLTVIPKNEIMDKERFNRRVIITYIIGNIVVFIIFFLTLSILGINLSNLYQYPEYDVLKKVSSIGFFERTESTISLRWTFYIFTVTVMGVLFISKYIKHVFKISNERTNKKIIFLISLIVVLCGRFIFFGSGNFIIYFVLPIVFSFFFILIPFFIMLKTVKSDS
jgi:spore germination protein KB